MVLEDGKDAISKLDYTMREAAFLALAEVGYDADAIQSDKLKHVNASDWTKEEEDQFKAEMFRLRRDLPAVAKLMGKSITACHAYYLGKYKSTTEYRLLKTVCIDERDHMFETVEEDACAVCGDGGSLLICDGCECEYHIGCLQPALKSVPDGHWECDECVDAKFLQAREKLLQNNKIFVSGTTAASPSFGSIEEAKTIFKPLPFAVEAGRKFSADLRKALAEAAAG